MEENENKVENRNEERYVRKDIQGGYLYNKSEIEYYKQTQKIDIINNLMLGDYDVNGQYTMNIDMIKQLVDMKKIYQYSFGSTMFCQSEGEVGNFGHIDFAVKISSPQKGYNVAKLVLLEPIDKANGYYTNTNSSQISYFSSRESGSFVIEAFKRFNIISKKETGLIKKESNENVDLIIARKNYESLKKEIVSDKLEGFYKNLYEKKLKVLSKSNVGQKILEELSSEGYKINGWFVKEGEKGYYKALNDILDGLMEKYREEVLQDTKTNVLWNKINGEKAVDLEKLLSETNVSILKTNAKASDITLKTQIEKQVANELTNTTSTAKTSEKNENLNKKNVENEKNNQTMPKNQPAINENKNPVVSENKTTPQNKSKTPTDKNIDIKSKDIANQNDIKNDASHNGGLGYQTEQNINAVEQNINAVKENKTKNNSDKQKQQDDEDELSQ